MLLAIQSAVSNRFDWSGRNSSTESSDGLETVACPAPESHGGSGTNVQVGRVEYLRSR